MNYEYDDGTMAVHGCTPKNFHLKDVIMLSECMKSLEALSFAFYHMRDDADRIFYSIHAAQIEHFISAYMSNLHRSC